MNNDSHIVERAIIMAAGIGKRLQPITFHTPKPLITVNGKKMIDTVITALYANNITEIHVVIGYMKEKFYEWAKSWPGIDLIENPLYDKCNNISSLYVAKEYLDNCIILDGDQIIYNPSVLSPSFRLSGYNAVWCDNDTDEWLMQVDNGVVTSCSRTGGSHGWQLYSISRWNTEDGEKLKHYLVYEFERGNNQIYWDDVAMFCHFSDFALGIHKMEKTDVTEIDNLEELSAIDHNYKTRLETIKKTEELTNDKQ